MLKQIKKYVPQSIKQVLAPVYRRTFGQWEKRRLFLRMQKKHQMLLAKIKGKERIRVVFLAIHKSVWKVDLVFQKMLADPFFDPIILVCPYIAYGEERMWEDMRECLKYFNEKGYSTYSSYVEKEQRWVKLDELEPDIIFFTNPHDLTRKEYYEDAYLNYLSCYVPYFTDVASEYDLNNVYNQYFHNAVWINFLPDKYGLSRMSSVMANKGKNIKLSGSLFHEAINSDGKSEEIIWKIQHSKKKKIIYATHQSINSDDVVNLSTFLSVGEFMMRIAIKYQKDVQWSFRPHPILKSKLYGHPDWGIEKTDAYYDFWRSESFTQIDEADYIDLFKTSDAMIHDCGSFILEYLFTGKPCAYILINRDLQLEAINNLGIDALKFYSQLTTGDDIESFILKIIKSEVNLASNYKNFIKEKLGLGLDGMRPSQLIINSIKNEIKGLSCRNKYDNKFT